MKKWENPKLIVLVKDGHSAESVLYTCKSGSPTHLSGPNGGWDCEDMGACSNCVDSPVS